MFLVKDIAFIVALLSSIGLFLFGYFEGVRLCNKKGKVRGEGVIASISLAMVFALLANSLLT
ncbi:hypothetical protein [Sutcliffiella deserti]|uniref:hypothetical protein n=1 Tax=Sutcliffiella deserti TaxID=2875501 RepID=UPI001CBE761D|nr:hypothetical protein [Sutcliffiella deserti]